MDDAQIPGAVRMLIARKLDSIPELEALLLFRDDAGRAWTAEAAGRRLYVSTAVAASIVERLRERGFLACSGDTYRYAPESDALAQAVEQLAEAYSRHLVAVTNLVHAKPTRGVRDFADAFRLRKPR